jgi:hypothetical protein
MIKQECMFCKEKGDKKLIEGYTQKQVDYMMLQHIIYAHPEKISVKKLGGK